MSDFKQPRFRERSNIGNRRLGDENLQVTVNTAYDLQIMLSKNSGKLLLQDQRPQLACVKSELPKHSPKYETFHEVDIKDYNVKKKNRICADFLIYIFSKFQ